jgi:hypothetical protein
MKRARFSEEQIIEVLKPEAGAKVSGCVGDTGSRTRPSTLGAANMAGSRSPRCAGCGSWKKRIDA